MPLLWALHMRVSIAVSPNDLAIARVFAAMYALPVSLRNSSR